MDEMEQPVDEFVRHRGVLTMTEDEMKKETATMVTQ